MSLGTGGAALGTPAAAVLTIVDDDAVATLTPGVPDSWGPAGTLQTETSARPAEVVARTFDWFIVTRLASLGRWNGAQVVDLTDGINELGIWVVFTSPGAPQWNYVDFVRLKVNLVAAASPSQ